MIDPSVQWLLHVFGVLFIGLHIFVMCRFLKEIAVIDRLLDRDRRVARREALRIINRAKS